MIQILGRSVEIACVQALLHTLRAALDGEARGSRHRGGQGLGAAHPAEARRENPPTGPIAAVVLTPGLDEGFVRALHDALTADVDPGSGRHLAVHHQALAIEFVEVLPGRPSGHQIGVCNENAGRVFVGAEDSHRLARLDQ